MSAFKSKMHPIYFPLDPAGEAYSTFPDPLAVFKGPISKVRDRKGRKGKVEK